MHIFLKILLGLCVGIVAFQILVFLILLVKGIYKYFLMKEVNYAERYGLGSYVVITGASSGQGKIFAKEFARRQFNLILVGSKRSHNTKQELEALHPSIDVVVVVKNFNDAFQDGFFDDIEDVLSKKDISILVNNIGHRTGWNPYHEKPASIIRDTIACGTIVQARMSQIVIQQFMKRKGHFKSGIVNISAQTMHPTFGLGLLHSNHLSVPYLSVYEASNYFGYAHSNSLSEEYKDTIDIINITPGAVVTSNTSFLQRTAFQIDASTFVKNCMKLIGNVQGTTCAYWGHAISMYLINFWPWMKPKILHETGELISREYMNQDAKCGR